MTSFFGSTAQIRGIVEKVTQYYVSRGNSEQLGTKVVHPTEKKIILGVCAREKKTKGKPMQAVLKHLVETGDFEIIVFTDEVLLNLSADEWPTCEAMITFFSSGFPMDKALQYVERVKPFMVNDLESQIVLMDRRDVYNLLEENNIPTPRYAILERDENNKTMQVLKIEDDGIIIDGKKFLKPFVEKPIDADDHNIRIYFPPSAGGGAQHLFRKIGNKSSQFVPDCNEIRSTGSYIIEEFQATEGTDVKVYTVGGLYAHAEARKSPAVDGMVQRTKDGKEVRFPVLLDAKEKLIARNVSKAFKQMVCGFDFLRTNGKSLVCDVNGWSFVKGNAKYFEDTALILRESILREVCPERLQTPLIDIRDVPPTLEDETKESVNGTEHVELRCVVGVFRHSDRTPKQKMKMLVTNQQFLSFFNSTPETPNELKIKKPNDLQRLLDLTRQLLSKGEGNDSDIEERLDKLMQMRYVLEKGGHFSGINRKVQIKALKHRRGGHRSPLLHQMSIPDPSPVSPSPQHDRNQTSRSMKMPLSNVCENGNSKERSTECDHRLSLGSHSSELNYITNIQEDSSNTKPYIRARTPSPPSARASIGKLIASEIVSGMSDDMSTGRSAMDLVSPISPPSSDNVDAIVESAPTHSPLQRTHEHHPRTKSSSSHSSLDAPQRQRGSSLLSTECDIFPLSNASECVNVSPFDRENQPLTRTSCGVDTTEFRRTSSSTKAMVKEALLVLKWGGELTLLGRDQARTLGETYRCTMYPGESHGLLRLHSTFRHDLKIYCSDEGRVQTTAAAFTKGFLALEGNLTPILVSLCRKDVKLLDDSSKAKGLMKEVKETVHEIMGIDRELTEAEIRTAVPTGGESFVQGLRDLKNPQEACRQVLEHIRLLNEQLHAKRRDPEYQNMELQAKETITLILKRWEKLEKDFYSKKKTRFDISKIPDIYDCVKYDIIHNGHMGLDGLSELYEVSFNLTKYIVPQEYGLTKSEKAQIGRKIAGELVRKIMIDLAIASESYNSTGYLGKLETVHRLDTRFAKDSGVKSYGRHVRTRLYFTSESHIHSLLNILRYGTEDEGIVSESAEELLGKIPELNYLSQIVMMLFENYNKPLEDPERFMVKMLFSPGIKHASCTRSADDRETLTECEPFMSLINEEMTLIDVEMFLNTILEKLSEEDALGESD